MSWEKFTISVPLLKKGLLSGYCSETGEFTSIRVTSASTWEKSGFIVASNKVVLPRS